MAGLLPFALTNAAAAGLLALLAWTASRLSRRQSLVHGLWLLAIVRLLTPPVLPVRVLPTWDDLTRQPVVVVATIPPSLHRGPASGVLQRSFVDPTTPARAWPDPATRPRIVRSPAPSHAAPPLPERSVAAWTVAADTLLGLGALAVLALTAARFLRFRRLLARADAGDERLARRTLELGQRLGLRRIPTVWLVRAPLPPLVWPAAGGPRLVLPAGLLAQLADDELDSLLAHELAHVRRGDHWVRLVEVAATALFWWYPVTWWARGALRRAEERCCDEWVLRVLPSSAEAYARGLLKSLTFVSGEPPALPAGASGAGPVHDLEARLKEILMTRPLPHLSRPLRVALAAAAVIGLAIFPTRAQSREAAADAPAAVAAPASPAAAPVGATPAVVPVPPTPATAAATRSVRHPAAVMALDAAPFAAAMAAAVAGGVSGGIAGGVRGGVLAGVPGGVLAGVPGGVMAGVPGGVMSVPVRALIAGVGPAVLLGGTDDPALDAERRSLEDQRRKLRQQEIEIEQRSLDLEARAETARRKAEADRLRAEGRTAELARVEKEGELSTRELGLRKRQLEVELEGSNLEARLEQAARADEDRVTALEKAGQEKQAEDLRRELEHAQQAREQERQGLEKKEQALEAELEAAGRERQALEAEVRVSELRNSSEELKRTLAEQLDSLREALPEAGAQKAALESEIRKLLSALDALGGAEPRPRPRTTPRPQSETQPQPQPRGTPRPQP